MVNVTAGAGLTIGEFTQVGQCVEEFASKDATVVVGTVIDESMQEDIKVTIVATGLGEASSPEGNSKSKTEMRFCWSLEQIAKVPLLILDEPAYRRKAADLVTEESAAIEINQ